MPARVLRKPAAEHVTLQETAHVLARLHGAGEATRVVVARGHGHDAVQQVEVPRDRLDGGFVGAGVDGLPRDGGVLVEERVLRVNEKERTDVDVTEREQLAPQQRQVLHVAGEVLSDEGGVVVDVQAGEHVRQQLSQRRLEQTGHDLGDGVLLEDARERFGDDAHAQWEQLEEVELEDDRLGAQTAEVALSLREEVDLVREENVLQDVRARLGGRVALRGVVVTEVLHDVLLHDAEQLHDQLARLLRLALYV